MARQAILLHATEMEPGDHDRIVCPTCGGGSTKERSLSISVDESGKPLWHCFRANCSESGGGSGARFIRTKRPGDGRKQTARPFTGVLATPTIRQLEFLRKRIGWTARHVELGRVWYAPESDRFAFPIFGPMGNRRGYVLRSYNGAEPKALTRMDIREPHLSWYRPYEYQRVVVVEDIPSAVRAAMYVPAVALCGSGASRDYAAEIAAHYTQVVWALDEDATRDALRLQREHSLLFERSEVLVLETDIKDMEEKEIRTMLEPYQDRGDRGE